MSVLLIALAVACVVFWRAALKIAAMLAIFLIVSGIVLVIQDMHR